MIEGTGTFASMEEAREFFAHDRFATESGMTLDELKYGSAVCSFEITPHHQNAEGGVMGGAIFTLMDFAFAAASSNVHRPTVAQQVSVSFLSRPKGRRLIASASCRKDGRVTCVYQVDVTDETGRYIATAVMTGYKLQN